MRRLPPLMLLVFLLALRLQRSWEVQVLKLGGVCALCTEEEACACYFCIFQRLGREKAQALVGLYFISSHDVAAAFCFRRSWEIDSLHHVYGKRGKK